VLALVIACLLAHQSVWVRGCPKTGWAQRQHSAFDTCTGSETGVAMQFTIVMVAAAVHLWLWLDEECRRLAAKVLPWFLPCLGRRVCPDQPSASAAAEPAVNAATPLTRLHHT
jgi:hypothetical protein